MTTDQIDKVIVYDYDGDRLDIKEHFQKSDVRILLITNRGGVKFDLYEKGKIDPTKSLTRDEFEDLLYE